MATLVLTVVGGAIGGPIGAAIGSIAGQAIDREILFRPKGREGPRLTELAVQTSSYGAPIAKVFGTMRAAGSVIWATDLIESRSTSRSGKGQPSVTSYSYAASFAVALSGRPILGVGRIWAEGKLLRGAAGDWKTVTGFRLHTGDEDQPIDPLIAAAEGIGSTPAHRGIAYAVLENLQLADFGNRIPSLTFEVFADPAPPAIGAIAAEIASGVIRGPGPVLTLDGFSAYGDSAGAVLGLLAQAAGAWFAPAGDGLAIRYDSGVVTMIADAGYESRTGGVGRRTRTIRPIETVPQMLALAHYDPARDYQTGVQAARRPGAGQRTDKVEMPAAMSASAAKTMAEAVLARAEAARVQRRVTLDATAIGIAPGDCVAIEGEAGVWRVASVTTEAMAVALDLVPLAPASLPSTASGGRAIGARDDLIGTTILHAFETPALDDALLTRPRLTIVAAGSAPGWRRAALLYSLDGGASWIAAGGTAAPAMLGVVTVPPGPGAATLIDRGNIIEIELAHDAMTLESADAAAIDRGANLAIVGDELLQFGRATQIGPRRWRLGDLWRARRAMAGSAHGIGERFALIESEACITLPVSAAMIGQSVRMLATGVGDTTGPVAADVAVTGLSVLPPTPVRLTATLLADGDTRVSWVRRSRVGWGWTDGTDAALGEERESYRVTVTGATTRTITTPAPQAIVTAAERAGTVTVTVRQRGTHGESPPATIILS